MFFDDLVPQGYTSLTKTFLNRSKIDEEMKAEELESLIKSMIKTKDIARDMIFKNFLEQE